MIVLVVRVTVAVGILLTIAGAMVCVAAGQVVRWLFSGPALLGTLCIAWGALVWSVASWMPRNRAIWAVAASAFGGLGAACLAMATVAAAGSPEVITRYVPAEHPATVTQLLWIALPAISIGVFVPLTFGLLLFPDGTLPSRRWRAVGLFAALSIAGLCVAGLAAAQPDRAAALSDSAALEVAVLASGLAVMLGVAALVQRFRAGSWDVRRQCEWVIWGVAVCAFTLLAGLATAGFDTPVIPTALFAAGSIALIGAYWTAIRRRWLPVVDLVISRSIVYGSLTAFVIVVDVVCVVAASSLWGSTPYPSTLVAIVATTGIAAGFQPLRRRLQGMADRTVLGKTATPHRVLSEFTRRVAANGDDLLTTVARSLVEGTGAVRAQVWLEGDGRGIKAAEWSNEPVEATRDESRFEIRHDDVTLGWLVLAVPAGGRLSVEDRGLAEQVASGMGLALRNARLTATLEGRVARLRASRRRIVALQDDTRRRLERDLHDGAQQQLVALRVKLGLARVMADRGGAAETAAAIDEVSVRAETAIEALRDLARGVYPPLLEAEGLAASVSAAARRCPFPVHLRLGEIGRYDREVESTVNRCVVEGLRQVVGHGSGQEVMVRVGEVDQRLTFEIRRQAAHRQGMADARPAFDCPSLKALVDRVDALSGSLSVNSTPGVGPVITGEIPVGPETRP